MNRLGVVPDRHTDRSSRCSPLFLHSTSAAARVFCPSNTRTQPVKRALRPYPDDDACFLRPVRVPYMNGLAAIVCGWITAVGPHTPMTWASRKEQGSSRCTGTTTALQQTLWPFYDS